MFEPKIPKPDYSQPNPQMDSWTNLGPGESSFDPLEPAKQRAIIDDQFETVLLDSDDIFSEPEIALNDPNLVEDTASDPRNPMKLQSDQIKSDPGISDDVKIDKDPRDEDDSSKTEFTPVSTTNTTELPKDIPIPLL